jgi:DNA repair exonuclease SbcCD nuclease subunit
MILKIAITADNHLTSQAKNPERFLALADIFKQCGELGVQLLIIAGDLFDQSLANYAEFEAFYQASRPNDLTTVIIPGNHDRQLNRSAIAGESLQVYSEPTIRPLNESRLVLFLPYQENRTMGEAIAPFADQLAGKRWFLVGHGDWSASLNAADPYEQGSYMPLTTADIKRYQPEIVILGHIHLSQQSGLVYYPGSPCPLNISETGIRKFLVLDTDKGEITSQVVNSHLLFIDEHLLILPVANDLELLEKDFSKRREAWDIPGDRVDQIQIRLKISGCSYSDRQMVYDKVNELIKPYRLYQDAAPDLGDLVHSQDPDRAEITTLFMEYLDRLDWEGKSLQPDKGQVLEQALRRIYRVTP